MQGKYNVYLFFLYNPVLLGTSDKFLFISNTSIESINIFISDVSTIIQLSSSEHIKYPCLEQLYIVDVMKILPVFFNILEQVQNLKEVSWNQVMPRPP